jgi:hypothetical protein
MNEESRIRGTLTIELRDDRGEVVLRRRANNTVVRSGAELIAALFAGRSTAAVNGMGVGTNAMPLAPPYEATALTLTDAAGGTLSGPTAAALAAEDVKIETLAAEMRVRVSIRGLIPKNGALASDGGTAMLGESALGALAADGSKLTTIYNRVVFEPVPKSKDHELALYWEISFPYGV